MSAGSAWGEDRLAGVVRVRNGHTPLAILVGAMLVVAGVLLDALLLAAAAMTAGGAIGIVAGRVAARASGRRELEEQYGATLGLFGSVIGLFVLIVDTLIAG